MKVITITEENMKYVFGRIKKFFYNNNHTGFKSWHNFDCGFKKHISQYIYIDGEKNSTVCYYPTPETIEYKRKGTVTGIHESYILLYLTETDSFTLHYGDKVAFLGNRIIIRTKCYFLKEYNYTYSVFQVFPISQYEQNKIKIRSRVFSGTCDKLQDQLDVILCNHRNENGDVLIQNADGTVTCSICGTTFTPEPI